MNKEEKKDRAFTALCFLLMRADDVGVFKSEALLEQYAHAAFNAVEAFERVAFARGGA